MTITASTIDESKVTNPQRRQALAASHMFPAFLAGRFTIGQRAVLSVIGREVQRHGSCCLPLDTIATQAGTCRTSVRSALRRAAGLSVVAVQERPQDNDRHLPHEVTVACTDWQKWLASLPGECP
jgi:hypothetical protein